MKKLTLEDILFLIDEMDIGDAKKTRIKSYVRRAFFVNKDDQITLQELVKMSRVQIVKERKKL